MTRQVTFGVEEEFFLVDAETFEAVPMAAEIRAAIPSGMREYIHFELVSSQLETATPPCSGAAALRNALFDLRSVLTDAAATFGCRVLPAGLAPLSCVPPPPLTYGERYTDIADRFGALTQVQGLCACHVHVAVDGPDRAVAAGNLLRAYLPLLLAISGNSPFLEGRDTGYASWRAVMVARWPTGGAPPWLDSAAEFAALTDSLTATGAMIDPGMLYWFVRPSPNHPTVETRISDVCPTVDDTMLVALLVRALVVSGIRGPRLHDHVLRAAIWRAAKNGFDQPMFDAFRAAEAAPREALDALVTALTPTLDGLGDLEEVHRLAALLDKHGTGADRQRRWHAATPDLRVVSAHVADQTLALL